MFGFFKKKKALEPYHLRRDYYPGESTTLRLRLSGDSFIGLHDESYVHIDAFVTNHDDTKLLFEGIEGTILLPKQKADLELDIYSVGTPVKGEVAHPGVIRTDSARVDLSLRVHLQVDIQTRGGVIVDNMEQDDGLWLPPGIYAAPELDIQSNTGVIKLRYIK